MKQLLFTLVSILLINTSGFAQQIQQISVDDENYQELKSQGALENATIQNAQNSELGEHTTVYPAGDGLNGRDINCDCWVEPDETYTLLQNITGTFDDGSSQNLAIPFDFQVYNDVYNSFYININGNLSFGNAVGTFSPAGFPYNAATMVAPFWGDVDLRCADCGEIYYKVTEDAVFVNWVDVAYYNQNTDKKNTFQAIITNGENDFVGIGRNINFCYRDMQWTTGDASQGTNGFGGAAATVGTNNAGTGNFIQFGRFSQNNGVYDGPFGAEDGINWLDFQSFTYNAASSNDNVAPIATNTGLCDTVQVCINEEAFISVEFIAPESGQTVSLSFEDGGIDGISDVTIEEGSTGVISFVYTGLAENIGVYPIVVTATDDGDPPQSTSITTYLEVVDVVVPPLTIDGPQAFCAGNSTVLTASEGFDTYQWNPGGCNTPDCEFDSPGTVTVTATLDVCTVTSPPIDLVEEPYTILDVDVEIDPICSTDSTLVTCEPGYLDHEWAVYDGFTGNLYGPLDQESVYASSGTFIVTATSQDGCPAQRIFTIGSTDADIPNDIFSGLYCDDLTEVEFCCGSATSSPGSFTIYYTTSGPNAGPWTEGSTTEVFLNGESLGVFPTADQVANSNGLIIQSFQVVYGDEVEIVYNNSAGSDITAGLTVFNCIPFPAIQVPLDPDGGTVFDEFTGCTFSAAFGEWEILDGPDGASFTVTDQYNTNFTPGDWGTYDLHFFSATCGVDYYYELTYGQSPDLEVNGNSFDLCEGETQVLEATITDPLNDSDFSWSTNDTDLDITVDESGTYCATIVNQCATVEECIEVDVTPLPVVDVDAEYQLCDGASTQIDPVANDDASFIYDWSSAGGFNADGPVETISETDDYTVTVSNQCGSDSESFTVSNLPTPTASLPMDELLCDGATLDLDPVQNDDPSFEYDWSGSNGFSSDDPDVTVDETGTYSVSVSNECGTASASTDVLAFPTPNPTLLPLYSSCDGDDITLNPLSSTDESFVYSWTGPGGFFSDDEEISVDQAGSYTFSVDNVCLDEPVSISTQVSLDVEPVIDLNTEIEFICPNTGALLQATASAGNTVNYSWSYVCGGIGTPEPIEGVNSSSYEVYSDAGAFLDPECVGFGAMYIVTASNACGSDADSAYVYADPCQLIIPNVFSPDGDANETNETFYVQGLETFILRGGVVFRVYSRWGNLVYESTDYKNDWDASGLSDGTYYFELITPDQNSTEYNGHVTVVRN